MIGAIANFKKCLCCNPCSHCNGAPQSYQITLSGIVLCDDWSGEPNGTYQVPLLGDAGDLCIYRLDDALTLTGPTGDRNFIIYLFLREASARLQVLGGDPFSSVFNTNVGNNQYFDTTGNCSLLGESVPAAEYVCGQQTAGFYSAVGIGGTAFFESGT